MKMVNLLMVALIGLSLSAQAKITPLKVDEYQVKKTKTKYIKVAHDVIKHQLSQDKLRFFILQAALTNKKIQWLLEEDGGDYFILRWDYSQEVIYTRVEFDEKYIQLKYEEASETYQCEINKDGICYRNKSKKYYVFMKRLRKSIMQAVLAKGA